MASANNFALLHVLIKVLGTCDDKYNLKWWKGMKLQYEEVTCHKGCWHDDVHDIRNEGLVFKKSCILGISFQIF